MITGFNTDIEYNGVTYHVQTEDKGTDTPLILSLVYNRGTILASKRSPYDDLMSGGFDEKVLAERLQKQHKLICAAVRAGRLEDLKRMTMKESALKQKGLIAQKEKIAEPAADNPGELKPVEKTLEEIPAPPQIFNTDSQPLKQPVHLKVPVDFVESPIEEQATRPIPKPKEELVWDVPIDIFDGPIVEAVHIFEEETILPAEAVEIITDFAKAEIPDDESMNISFLNDVAFKGGERKTVSIMVQRGNDENGVSGANIMVKILGSSFRPLIFHSKTDSNGVATVHLQLPHFKSGRAAILVKAMSDGEEAELRRVIQQG